jgi:enoyl-CoA hydratase/carnithine racemase
MEPSKMTENFLVERDGPITTITFNRPERRNCLDEGVILEFERHLHAVRDDRECRVLIVTGKGTAFCAGADQAMFKAPAGAVVDPAERRRRMGEFGKRWPRLIGRAFDARASRSNHDWRDQWLCGRRWMVVRARVRFCNRSRRR